jgi:hypothetical protein
MVKRLNSRLERFARIKQMVGAACPPKAKGVVYIGHLPTGFEEEELRRFFS